MGITRVLTVLARGRLGAKRDRLQEALAGRVTAHHSFLLTEHLSALEYLDEAIARVSAETDQRLTAEHAAIALLKRALIAVGHTILIIYMMLMRKQPYQGLGAAYFDQWNNTGWSDGSCSGWSV
jgi:hypothetical protein